MFLILKSLQQRYWRREQPSFGSAKSRLNTFCSQPETDDIRKHIYINVYKITELLRALSLVDKCV